MKKKRGWWGVSWAPGQGLYVFDIYVDTGLISRPVMAPLSLTLSLRLTADANGDSSFNVAVIFNLKIFTRTPHPMIYVNEKSRMFVDEMAHHAQLHSRYNGSLPS